MKNVEPITPGLRRRRDFPMCDARGSRDVSDVSRRQAASVNVPARLTSVELMKTLAAWAQDLARTLLERLPSPPLGPRPGRRRPGPQPRTRPRRGHRAARGRRLAARHRLPPRTRRNRPPWPGRRPLPPRRPARRTDALPSGRASLLRRHRGRGTRPRPCPEPRVRPAAAATGRRADLLRHDHQPRRRSRPRNPPPGGDPRPLRLGPPGQPLHPAAPPRSSWKPSARSTPEPTAPGKTAQSRCGAARPSR